MENMNKKIEDYLHLYIGCSAMVNAGGDRIEKIVDIDFLQTYWDKEDAIYLNSPTLILRPESDLTEKESEQIAKFSEGLESSTTPAQYMAKAINFLRQQQIDCDGLIEAGLATPFSAKG